MENSYNGRKPQTNDRKRPIPVIGIILIVDFIISLLTPILMEIFSFSGYLIDLAAIMGVYAVGGIIYSRLYAKAGNRVKKLSRFYARGIVMVIPAILISTTYLLFYSRIISGLKEGGTILLIIVNILFALSIMFPFVRQNRILKGKDKTLSRISGSSPALLKMKLQAANCREPLLYVKNLGGRKIANASQIGITKPVIIMTDFLYENMAGSDLSAILGHEMGHFENGDAFRSILMFTIPAFLTLDLALYAMITLEIIPILIAAIFIACQVLDMLFIFPGSRRKSEIGADRFVGMKLGMAEEMVSALETLIVMNGRLPEYRFFSSRTHPSIELRISILRKYFTQGSETFQVK